MAASTYDSTSLAGIVEQAEAESALRSAEARRRWLGDFLVIDSHLTSDACGVFAGHWTHLTHAVVLSNGLTAATLDNLECFFSSLWALTTVHVSTEFPDAVSLLRNRGYDFLGEATVVGFAGPTCTGLPDSVFTGENELEWIRTVTEGFLSAPVSDEAALEIGGVASRTAGTSRFLARVDGQPASAAGMLRIGDTAILYCDSTVQRFRGMGLHKALIHARVEAARRWGAARIVATVQADSTSESNYLQCGFKPLYARRTFRKP